MFMGHQIGVSPVARCVFPRSEATRNTDGASVVGYARAFNHASSLDGQAEALAAVGAAKVFCENVKGAAVIRPALDALLADLAPGECVVVASLDRLAWREDELRQVIEAINAKRGHLWSLAEGLDTRTPTDAFKIMRALEAFSSGVRLAREAESRPPQKDRRQKIEDTAWAAAFKRLSAGEITPAQVARSLGVARSTITRRQKARAGGCT